MPAFQLEVADAEIANECQLNTPADIAAYGSHMFVVNEDGNSLSVLDARTGACLKVYRNPAIPFSTPVTLTVDSDRAWMVNAGTGANDVSSVVELAVS